MERTTVTIAEAAKLLNVGRTSVYKLIASQSLRTVRILSRQYVTVESIRALTGDVSSQPQAA